MDKINRHEIDKTYYYEGKDLGCTVGEEGYSFKVWSPLATEIKVAIYENYEDTTCESYAMAKGQCGVWETVIEEPLEGKYYTFIVSDSAGEKEAVDPYAKALSVNGEKAAIIKMEDTNPKDWKGYKRQPLASNTDAVIYELHIRDLSIEKDSGIKYKGKFLGLAEEDTKTSSGSKTGLAHIKDLGVTHVQLLPIYDFGSVDERTCNLEGEVENSIAYNWGYDPMNYNAPEGTYSTNPYDPTSRIKELKMAIKALHDNGIGVIMDVVYNHMYDVAASGFDKIMPGYFFRYDEDGKLRDESFCGNAVATENKMTRKFIVESIKHWATEYQLDGFRFDLMGLIDVETMQEIRRELDKIDPSIMMLGEGWNMGWTLKDEDKAIQPNAKKLKNIAFFSDDIRDALRGSSFDGNPRGYLSGLEGIEEEVKKSVVGGVDYSDMLKTWGEVEPNQVVNYIECHDNHTLFDKLKLEIEDEKEIQERSRLGASIIMLSQGIPFIHAGQEFFRTKQGVENSYNANDSINKMDWERKAMHQDTVEYFKGLISLRKQEPAFRMKAALEVKENLVFIDAPSNVIAYILDQRLLVIHNANNQDVVVPTTIETELDIVVNKKASGTAVIERVDGAEVAIESLSTIVAYIK